VLVEGGSAGVGVGIDSGVATGGAAAAEAMRSTTADSLPQAAASRAKARVERRRRMVFLGSVEYLSNRRATHCNVNSRFGIPRSIADNPG
jgi:hypothetical protein